MSGPLCFSARGTILSDSKTHPANTEFASLGAHEQAEVGPAVKLVLPAVMQLAGRVGPGTRVLDVGCGLGALGAAFAARGCSVVGIDLDEHNLEVARRAYPAVRFI